MARMRGSVPRRKPIQRVAQAGQSVSPVRALKSAAPMYHDLGDFDIQAGQTKRVFQFISPSDATIMNMTLHVEGIRGFSKLMVNPIIEQDIEPFEMEVGKHTFPNFAVQMHDKLALEFSAVGEEPLSLRGVSLTGMFQN